MWLPYDDGLAYRPSIGSVYEQVLGASMRRFCSLIGTGLSFWTPSECRTVLHFLLENIEAQRRLAICNLAGYTVYVFA
jgi:hypothetical protein